MVHAISPAGIFPGGIKALPTRMPTSSALARDPVLLNTVFSWRAAVQATRPFNAEYHRRARSITGPPCSRSADIQGDWVERARAAAEALGLIARQFFRPHRLLPRTSSWKAHPASRAGPQSRDGLVDRGQMRCWASMLQLTSHTTGQVRSIPIAATPGLPASHRSRRPCEAQQMTYSRLRPGVVYHRRCQPGDRVYASHSRPVSISRPREAKVARCDRGRRTIDDLHARPAFASELRGSS